MSRTIPSLVMLTLLSGCLAPRESPSPAPCPPLPSPDQLAWQSMQFNLFVHFGVNTFTDQEWGTGHEPESIFNPPHLDCRQWAAAARAAGARGIVLTCKHHDGFCLWPSKLTRHSVASSPWKNGHGDVVRELSAACRAAGLKFGVYLSPWDRNCPLYGDSSRYNDYYVAQLTELLTNYGDIFEVWFDGACGEGQSGRKQIYDWPRYIDTIRRLQPHAVIFSDAGPDVRWVGNENGFAGDTCWAMLNTEQLAPGMTGIENYLNTGDPNGRHWVPPECDVSIRPGWFYHASEDAKLKSVAELLTIYERSVGRGANLLLNVPADRRGLLADGDVERLKQFRAARESAFSRDLAAHQPAKTSSTRQAVRAADPRFAASAAVDGDDATYWSPSATDAHPWLQLTLPGTPRISHIVLSEPIALGQRVESFTLESRRNDLDDWHPITRATTIGRQRIITLPPRPAGQLRLTIEKSRAIPLISTIAVYGGQ